MAGELVTYRFLGQPSLADPQGAREHERTRVKPMPFDATAIVWGPRRTEGRDEFATLIVPVKGGNICIDNARKDDTPNPPEGTYREIT